MVPPCAPSFKAATRATSAADAGQAGIGGSSEANGADIRTSHVFLWRDAKMRRIGALGGRRSSAAAINGVAQVVGTSLTSSGAAHGFVCQGGNVIELGTLRGCFSEGDEVNNRGPVVGKVAFGALDGRQTIPTAISEAGVGPGGAIAAPFDGHAFVWRDGRITPLPGPPLPSAPVAFVDRSGTRVLGTSYETAGLRTRMFLWSRRR